MKHVDVESYKECRSEALDSGPTGLGTTASEEKSSPATDPNADIPYVPNMVAGAPFDPRPGEATSFSPSSIGVALMEMKQMLASIANDVASLKKESWQRLRPTKSLDVADKELEVVSLSDAIESGGYTSGRVTKYFQDN